MLFDDGETCKYDYLVIATGPRLAFEEVEGPARTAATPNVGVLGRPCRGGIRGSTRSCSKTRVTW